MRTSCTSLWLISVVFACSFLPITCPVVCAQDTAPLLLDIHDERNQWQTVSARMALDDYREACRKNNRLARRAILSYSKHTLTSLGVPEMAMNLAGTALSMATRTTRLPLNKSKNMSLEFRNMVDEDRTLLFEVNIDW